MRMRSRILFFLLALGVVLPAHSELRFKALSVTATSQTYLLSRPQAEVALCNVGTDEAYFRLFWDGEATAAATTAYSVLPAGTAAAPYCISVGTAKTQPAPWKAVSIVAAGGETCTVHVQSE